jgi:hypothetical protein
MFREVYNGDKIKALYDECNDRYQINIKGLGCILKKEEFKELSQKSDAKIAYYLSENYNVLLSKMTKERVGLEFLKEAVYVSLKKTNNL